MGRLKYELIKEAFKKEGYTLLSKEYINSKTKLDYRCPRGHKHSITWINWSVGQRCFYCYNEDRMPSIEYIKSSFENEGYELLSDKYINSKVKLNYRCPAGHLGQIRWNGWQQGNRCSLCNSKIKINLNSIRKAFAGENYTLLSKKYKNNKQKLKYICSKGHKHIITWNDWKEGHRCPHCSGQGKPKIEDIRKDFEREGYILLSKKYKNNRTKLKYECPFKHVHAVSWNNWKDNNVRCPTCNNIDKTIRFMGNKNPLWKGGISCEPYCQDWTKEYKEFIKARDGYICLNPYCNKVKTYLTIHHIDYDKKNCTPNNLITICNSCNVKANKNRSWHTSWYQAILSRRYNYKY